jgi:hypothetical protein
MQEYLCNGIDFFSTKCTFMPSGSLSLLALSMSVLMHFDLSLSSAVVRSLVYSDPAICRSNVQQQFCSLTASFVEGSSDIGESCEGSA